MVLSWVFFQPWVPLSLIQFLLSPGSSMSFSMPSKWEVWLLFVLEFAFKGYFHA
jgi:hypothetical protein